MMPCLVCLRFARAIPVISTLAWCAASPAAAQVRYETVHEFVQGPGRVYGRLAQAIDGNIYGVTTEGGAYSGGTIFVLRRFAGGWLPALTLHNFEASEGTHPIGGLIEATPGVLYGTTSQNGRWGGGTIFRFTVLGGFQVLSALNPSIHGARPATELTPGIDGNLYGTASRGGSFDKGTIFRITPAGALSAVHSFSGPDGESPAGALALGLDGSFYGTAHRGGLGRGTVFRITRSGTFTLLSSFQPTLLSGPIGQLTLAWDGAFYGVTTDPQQIFDSPIGGGIFRWSPITGMQEVFQFGSLAYPAGGLTLGRDGWLYGQRAPFAVFRLRPQTFEFHSIVGSLSYPAAGMGGAALITADDGRLYGGTTHGGVGGYGAVFSVDASADVRVLHSFHSAGFHPTGTLRHAGEGSLHGTTYYGGSANAGTFVAVHAGGVVQTLASLPAGHGNLAGDVATGRVGTLLAPTTERLVEYAPDTGGIRTAFPAAPDGSPVVGPDGAIYAPVSFGLFADIRRIKDGVSELLYRFTGPVGWQPSGGLIFGSDGHLYGTTRLGGASNNGTIFKLALDGTLTTLHHFSGSDGKWPVAALVQDLGGSLVFYGTTSAGGDSSETPDGAGTIFKISSTGEFNVLHAFGAGEGRHSLARLTYGTDGRYFGTTWSGGLGSGTVFSIRPGGTFETIHRFAPGQGAYPYGGVSLNFDGFLYGTTLLGGSANVGVIYRLRLPAIE